MILVKKELFISRSKQTFKVIFYLEIKKPLSFLDDKGFLEENLFLKPMPDPKPAASFLHN
jgi:hypothetical protein